MTACIATQLTLIIFILKPEGIGGAYFIGLGKILLESFVCASFCLGDHVLTLAHVASCPGHPLRIDDEFFFQAEFCGGRRPVLLTMMKDPASLLPHLAWCVYHS